MRKKIVIYLSVVQGGLLLFPELSGAQDAIVAQSADAEQGLSGILYLQSWSPYAAGAAIGVLSWLAFLLSNHPLGISTAFARSSGMIETAIVGEKAKNRPYYQRFEPKVDWEWMLLAGVFAGALLSAMLSGDFAWRFTPAVWIAEFGDGWGLRWITAFAGGVIMGIGARWANGCTSGHALSGTMQMVLSSWLAAVGIFIGGIVTAFLLF